MIRLQTLGTLDLRNGDGSEIRAIVAQPKRLALLAYLGVASPPGFHRRDRLLALLWPEHGSERARASLNRALHFLRRELGSDVLLSRGSEEVGLDRTKIWCDAAAVLEASENRRHREAVEVYRGDILPGFFVSGAPEFGEWLERARTLLKERVSAAAWALADEEERAGNFTHAAQWARRGLEVAPFREVGLRRLLTLLDRAGDRVGAAHAYEQFTYEITAELDLVPSPETRALIDDIRSRISERERLVTQPNALSAGAAPARDLTTRGALDVVAPGDDPVGLMSAPGRLPHLGFAGRRLVRGTLALAAIAVIVVTSRNLSSRGEKLDPSRIDVVTFENRTGDASLDDLARAMTDRIIGALVPTGLFQSVAPAHGTERGWWRTISGGLSRLAVGTKTERGAVSVSGAVTRIHGMLHVQARLTDALRGNRVWAVPPIRISLASPELGIDELRARVLGGAAALRNPTIAALLPVAGSPPTFEAYQEFLQGLGLKSRNQRAEARTHYRLAVALDSSFTWPLVEAAMSALFDWNPSMEAADSCLRALTSKRTQLTPLQQHLTDYMLTSRSKDWVGAYRAIREAANLAPLHYSYAVAMRASYLSRPREAIEALLTPGMDSAYRGDVEHYWLMLRLSYHQVEEFGNELDAARRARRFRPDSRTALSHEIKALAALGNIDGVVSRLDTLLAMPNEQTWFTPAWAMILAAEELRAHGHQQPARKVAERAVAWLRSRPSEERAMTAQRYSLGYCLYFLNALNESEAIFRQLVIEFPDNEDYVGFLGAIAARRGDRLEAARHDAALARMQRSFALPGPTAIVNRAKIAALLGEHARAASLLRDAFGEQGTLELHSDIDFEGLRGYAPFRELTRPKG